jgi:hypothetical protein
LGKLIFDRLQAGRIMTACDLEPLMPGVAVHFLNSDKGRTFYGLEGGVGTALVEMRIDFQRNHTSRLSAALKPAASQASEAITD